MSQIESEFSRFLRPRHSKIVFEKCQPTLQNFYLPFPPLSYGRLRLGSPETVRVESFTESSRSPCYFETCNINPDDIQPLDKT